MLGNLHALHVSRQKLLVPVAGQDQEWILKSKVELWQGLGGFCRESCRGRVTPLRPLGWGWWDLT